MFEETRTFFENQKKGMEALQKASPELAKSFGALFLTTMKQGALPTKTKELVALGIALAKQCNTCTRIHVQKCLEAGCSREEILEASAVAVVMDGGPAFTHIPLVLETLDFLEK